MNPMATAGNYYRPLERIFAKAPVYLKDFLSNPQWLAMFLLARFVPFRHAHYSILAKASAKRQTAGAESRATRIPNTIIHSDKSEIAAIEELRRDGLITGLSLAIQVLEDIRRFARNNICYASFDYNKPMRVDEHEAAEAKYGCNILVAHFLKSVTQCDGCNQITQNAYLWDIAERHFGTPPKLVSTRLWYSFRSAKATEADLSSAAQSFHYDLDDWNQLKFFFYIEDVGKQDGPHKYISGSHRNKPFMFQLSPFVGRPEKEILNTYGTDALKVITGKAGYGFAEDSFGYHVGAPVVAGPRLLFEVSFGSTGVMKRRPYGTL